MFDKGRRGGPTTRPDDVAQRQVGQEPQCGHTDALVQVQTGELGQGAQHIHVERGCIHTAVQVKLLQVAQPREEGQPLGVHHCARR